MNARNIPFSLIFFLLFFSYAPAQYITVDDTYTPQQLVRDVLVNSACASVSNFQVSGGPFDDGRLTYAYFSGNGSSFPFTDGVILCSGRAFLAEGPNTTLMDDGFAVPWGGDDDLDQALGITSSTNATALEFDFVPATNLISFEYLMASEQYQGNLPCNYSDGFVFLLKKANTSEPYQNLAIIPGTTTPVRLTTVRPEITGSDGCPAQNADYFAGYNPAESPTNFNGQTIVMTAEATVTPGVTYHIKLVVADEGNYHNDSAIFLGGSTFGSKTDIGPNRLFATGNPLCDGEHYPLDAAIPGGLTYTWYKDDVVISGANSAIYTATATGTYRVEVSTADGCLTRGKVVLEYTPSPTQSVFTLLQCDPDNNGITQFNLNLAGELAQNNDPNLQPIGYYTTLQNAQNNTNAIANPQSYTNTSPNQDIYVALQNPYGCNIIAKVTLTASSNTVTNPPVTGLCDDDGTDDGFHVFNLDTITAQILAGLPSGLLVNYYISYNDALQSVQPISNPQNFINTVAGGQTLYARIYNAADCYGIAEADLEVYYFGGITDEEVILCGTASITLDAGAGFTSYSWNTTPVATTQTISVSQPGTYIVTLTNAQNCSITKTFTVKSSGRATGATYDIKDFTGNQNSITIYPQGTGNYEYSINGQNYQDSPVFNNLSSGKYTLYIKDKNGCGPVFTDTVTILDYPNFFTPNGDGTNETWIIPYMSGRPGVLVTVFDRYGKILSSFSGASAGWNGIFEGRPMPATDYWFVIELENGRKIKGHFSLIR
jgi:gliding motility-associated-like protein